MSYSLLVVAFIGTTTTHSATAYNILERLAKRPPISISDELGTSPAFNYALFDPLDLAQEENFAFYREAELKHGRVAMLATIGMVVPRYCLHLPPVACGLGAFREVPRIEWAGMILLVGLLENVVFVSKSDLDMPGDYNVGYFGLVDKARHERSLQSELENGRLAMIAFAVQVLSELTTGETVFPWEQFEVWTARHS